MSHTPERGLSSEQQAQIMLESFEAALVDISDNWEKYKNDLGEVGAFELRKKQLQNKWGALQELKNLAERNGNKRRVTELEEDLKHVKDALEETEAFINDIKRRTKKMTIDKED